MSLQEFTKLLRTRWVTVAVTTLICILGAIAFTLLTRPQYQASTRLFLSTNSTGGSVTDLYQANLLSQQRVLSYATLINGQTLAQRTIDKLGLGMSPEAFQDKVKATAKSDTVLIDVKVRDESPTRARDIANTMADEFVVMVRELETPKAGATPLARVVVEQRASTPQKPVLPNPILNLFGGLVVGLGVGVGLAVLREVLDNTVKDRQTVEATAHTGLVGSIPLDKERRNLPAAPFENDHSLFAESFRKLGTNLRFLSVDNPPRMIVVTSALPGEGKTTTTINLALALADAGHNVALVDGDMRRPMLDEKLGVIGAVGLSTVLSGDITLSEALQESHFPRLTVLSSGAVPPNPGELVGSLAAQKVLGQLRANFDYVIVDSSPLIAVADAAVLATSCDGALLVTRHGHTKRDQLAQAVRTLDDVGAPILGAVLTMAPPPRGAEYAYRHYRSERPAHDAGEPTR
ncbi:lipopolysaccharide biosynthesis [Mycolicibacterium canariasense]|uniref:non-specific protein-tyrosine kinase n=1 Tax=Mycolicibacterium canariasense TaxID=228230 RepID=A0A100W8E2_MYCCR|nr:polysaccharide biosynthesis tyrosine autokinase [Mycolicibacterium canariasense]MCV7212054.1 polysaccharide biosynthesis tyrosine autokinase [Mycolicibacterium canariasense]ORV04143.1 protein tyrosine kinase [Mycolicibacterium canariasense]GAS93430.1 lipopolysaccharide biosynthesis [Mycolicibacterium canariasense]